jgi:AmmeMemoRadiSam system protein B
MKGLKKSGAAEGSPLTGATEHRALGDEMAIRKSDFSGSWYPEGESECRDLIEEFAKTGGPCIPPEKERVGGIVPHAGWYYSGKIACHVVKCLKNGLKPDTIIVFGRHLHPGGKNYIMKEGQWSTPLGILEIDQDLGAGLVEEFPFTIETANRYEPDNTIEVQLPFIKYFFPEVKILPIGVPPAVASLRIGERAIEISQSMGRRVMILGSTDLTHYGYNYGYMPKGVGKAAVDWVKGDNDKRLIDLIMRMDAEGVIHESLKNHNACCSGAVAAAIAAAKKLGASGGHELLYSTSYDVRPDTSFVGYVGVVFS